MRALVTGGGGFLGRAVVEKLLARGYSVRSFSRKDYPDLRALGVDVIRGDLADFEAVRRASSGCAIVFHVGAKAGIWGPFEEFYSANVVGTKNVLLACRACGISRLVYTSSPSVVFSGTDMEGVDETAPYPDRYKAAYPATKAEAERMVLRASGTGLETVALRPHLVWGPGDTHLIPGILERGRQGRMRRLGRQPKLVDFTFIANAADAHLLAADKLIAGAPVGGRAYFITQGEPVELWEFINRILAVAGFPPVTRSVPARLGYLAGWFSEVFHRTFRLGGEPMMTRFLAEELSTAHWFRIDAARRDLGYEPKVSLEEGLKQLETWFSQDHRTVD